MTNLARLTVDEKAMQEVIKFKTATTLRRNGVFISLIDVALVGNDSIENLKALLPIIGGDAIEIKPSTIPKAGGGLFAKRAFLENEIVSFYDGATIHHVRSEDLVPELRTHARAVFKMRYTLLGNVSRDGTRVINVPDHGMGGGAWVNDSHDAPKKNNTAFVHVDNAHNDKYFNDKPDAFGRLILLIATRDIRAGDEIFTSYGQTYWDNVYDPPPLNPKKRLVGIADIPGKLVQPVAPPKGVACSNLGCTQAAAGLCCTCLAAPYCSARCCERHFAVHSLACASAATTGQ